MMKEYKGTYLLKEYPLDIQSNYQVINNVIDYDKTSKCIIVKSLNPDYYLLFGSLDIIITEKGSALSHLAIVGMEYGVPIIRIDEIISKIPEKGVVSVKNNVINLID